MHAREAGRRLTASWVSVLAALTRAFCIAACAGCAAPQAETVVLRGSDRVVGRAALGSQVVILTTEPALVRISPESGEVSRHPIAPQDRSGPKLWGLGAVDQTLYSVADFKRLVRLEIVPAGFHPRIVAPFDHAVGNMIDTPGGMAVQRVVDDAGQPIAAAVNVRGEFETMAAPMRVAMGLARAEEGLMHLLACSVPPRVLCWMPGANVLLAVDDRGIRPVVTLAAVPRIAPGLLIARPTARAIQDALWISDDAVVVLFQDGEASASRLGEFDLSGRLRRELAPSEPLRLLVSQGASGILAITPSGRLTKVVQ